MFWLLIAAGFGLLSLAHVAPFPFLLDAVAPAPAVWSMPEGDGSPVVYLTFDDGPNPTATPLLLDVLAEQQARATFFVIDRHLTARTAPIVRRMFDEGHAVGLHTHTRHWMVLPPDEVARRLQGAAERIEHLGGRRPCRAFRPHAGFRSGQMYVGLARAGYTLVGWGWSLWDFNWYRAPNPVGLADRLARRVSSGDIVVIHDGHHKNPRADRRYTVEAMGLLIPQLRAKGFAFGTIC
jgi:peptidoglycan/xylan/chitin deacetylase (PgdA/CDA1 family)